MEPILISFSICVLGVMAAVALFSVAMRGREEENGSPAPGKVPSPPGNFFLEEATDPGSHPAFPADALVLQLENHFKLEQEAAFAFLKGPSVDSLHARSSSPFRN